MAGTTTTVSVELIAEGTFEVPPAPCPEGPLSSGWAVQSQFSPTSVSFCVVAHKSDHVDAAQARTLPIRYKNGRNERLVVVAECPTPTLAATGLLAYWLHYPVLTETGYAGLSQREFSTEVRFVPLAAHKGRFVALPFTWTWVYYHQPLQAVIVVRPPRARSEQWEAAGATLDRVYYGFVSEDEPDADTDEWLQRAAWRDCLGNFVAEGVLTPVLSGGYKRDGYLVTLWVRVPDGLRLVFRLVYHDDQHQTFESPVFYAC